VTAPGSLRRDGARLCVAGALQMGTVAALAHPGQAAIAAGIRVVDLSGVEATDSAALALLLDWVRTAAAAGGPALSIEGMPPALLRLADLYTVRDLLPLAAPARGQDAGADPARGAQT
jgi:phospholipid transport system transporter-binding protein